MRYRNDTDTARFAVIKENWGAILKIIGAELPFSEEIAEPLNNIGISTDLNTFSVDTDFARTTFKATKDIRDKYVLSCLAWYSEIINELALHIE